MTVQQVAEELEVSANVVRMLCKTGQLGRVMNDGKRSIYLIYRNQVEAIKNAAGGTAAGNYEESNEHRNDSTERIPRFLQKGKR